MAHLNMMVASLALGGAERIVHETVTVLQSRQSVGTLFVLHDVEPSFSIPDGHRFTVWKWKAASKEDRLREAAYQVLDSGSDLLITHLVRVDDLRVLWACGVRTVPVVHNSEEGWQDSPDAYPAEKVPFVIAVADCVADQLRARGCAPPIMTIRHELQRRYGNHDVLSDREAIRTRYGIDKDTFLIGMVGCFKAQKAYPRAVRVLGELLRIRSAKLMVIGSWEHDYGYGRITYEVTRKLIHELGLDQDVLIVGAAQEVEPFYAAFDAYLNTSVYEGLSIALLEAQQWGCPVVAADVGGAAEILMTNSVLVKDPSDIRSYVQALSILPVQPHFPAGQTAYPDLIPRLWELLGHAVDAQKSRFGVLFVTNNLNMGGAQRSLTNLIAHLPVKTNVVVCVLGATYAEFYLGDLARTGVHIITFPAPANVVDTAERLLNVISEFNVLTLCYWNVDSSVKLMVSKILSYTNVRMVDVCPGSAQLREMEDTINMQHRLAFTFSDYMDRLDAFVCKCDASAACPQLARWKSKVVVIRNGVPVLEPEAECSAIGNGVRVVGTCGRIAPENRMEFLMDSFALVDKRVPDTSFVIVGDSQTGNRGYKQSLVHKSSQLGLRNVVFAGATRDVGPYLRSFRVFVSAFDGEGCSNALLEAMAAGTPVIATTSSASRELIEDGVDGFLVSNSDPHEMAERIESLLMQPELVVGIGQKSQSTVRRRFSMDRMVNDYRTILEC